MTNPAHDHQLRCGEDAEHQKNLASLGQTSGTNREEQRKSEPTDVWLCYRIFVTFTRGFLAVEMASFEKLFIGGVALA